MDITDAAEADAVTSSGRSKRQRAPLPENCYACETKVVGLYCHECGQKNDDCRRSIIRLGAETIGEVSAIDGRVLRTARSVLLRPGKHVREYGDGRRSPYSPPVRFFLVVTVLFFSALGLAGKHLVSFAPEITHDAAGQPDITFRGGFLTNVGDVNYTREQRLELVEEASTTTDSSITVNGEEMSRDEMIDRALALAENQSAYNQTLNIWIPRFMILLIPLMALVGAIFIRGRDALIYDHLLVALSTHAMAFLILIAGLVFSSRLPSGIFPILFFVGTPLHYWVSIKGAFGRGIIKTTFATFVVFFIYSIVLILAMVTVSTGWAAEQMGFDLLQELKEGILG